jgi:hypothetical protein
MIKHKNLNQILPLLVLALIPQLGVAADSVLRNCAHDINGDGYLDYINETVSNLTSELCRALNGAVLEPEESEISLRIESDFFRSSVLQNLASLEKRPTSVSQGIDTPSASTDSMVTYGPPARAGGRAPLAMREWVKLCVPPYNYKPRDGGSHYVCVQFSVDMWSCLNAMQIEGYEITNTVFRINDGNGKYSAHQIVDIHSGGLTYWFEPQGGYQVIMDLNGDGTVENGEGDEGTFNRIIWSTDPSTLPSRR